MRWICIVNVIQIITIVTHLHIFVDKGKHYRYNEITQYKMKHE